ncbi:SH3 domain-containing protein [Tropicimonas sp. IMCC34043]|uniref:SH3 domain-containing protein n=1 Tax=Tropicimonas sp. IMCC34043 TaxID=2248760 RepID=UPI001E4D2567|nr:SH3 domain-containing protein [Tropicimonas sp. IMCC34043]
MRNGFRRAGRGRLLILAIVAAQAIPVAALAAGPSGRTSMVEVTGVEDEDMLKMRAGPGTGYRVIVGLPNGTVLRNHGCNRVGGTPWCKVSLREARGLTGYVSGHYLTGN